ncbi:hypothetical protein [Arthrobacter sp. JSM 101049]|uniref:hypothetical protein n=1 Tax=Arthrobacter sp. JSM 101049 TaxID=929097 RepID=UPI0035678689
MRKSHKLLTAVALAGIAFAGGSAFTGTGLTNEAGSTQFIGGQVSQSVTGATLAGVDYDFTDSTQDSIKTINLSFANTEDGKAVTVNPQGGTGGAFSCTTISANASTCTFAPTANETGYTGLTSLDITVGTLDNAA